MLSGLTLAIIQTGNAFGPSLLGWLRNATGGYAVPIVVCMARARRSRDHLAAIGPAKDIPQNRGSK